MHEKIYIEEEQNPLIVYDFNGFRYRLTKLKMKRHETNDSTRTIG